MATTSVSILYIYFYLLAIFIAMKKQIVIGFLGVQLDMGMGQGRWEKWRPSVSLGMQEDRQFDRIELLVDQRRFKNLAQQVSKDIIEVSPQTEVKLHDFFANDPWDIEEMYAKLFDFVHNYRFDLEQEDYFVHITTGTHVAQIVWFLLTEARFLPAQIIQTSPPRKQNSDNIGSYTIIDLNLARYDKIAQRFARESEITTSFLKSGIETRSATFNRMIEQIERVAIKSKAPILLMGPTGAGKSMLARNLFELKKQKHALRGRFVEINCATLRGDGAGSALFGHVKGAFTGAQNERAGMLKSADGGLLFLDEIGELGLDEQAMLLRAIEDKKFPPLGGDKEVSSDFQLLAGTNRDLAVAVKNGRFRDDLFARLNMWTFHLPGLKERAEDIEPNLEFELDRFARTHNERVSFNKEARNRYLSFATGADALWPGNFRDLGASITRLATLASNGRITRDIVDEEISRLRRLWGQSTNNLGRESDAILVLNQLLGDNTAELDRFDRAQLIDVIEVCRACKNLSDAGRILFQASRSQKASTNDADRLRKYLAKFDISFEAIRHFR